MSEAPPNPNRPALVWFRRDLRLDDHAALAKALTAHERVHCCFVFDRAILDRLSRRQKRLEFIRESLAELDARLRAAGGALWCCHGEPERAVPALARSLEAEVVYASHDYEPAAIARDQRVAVHLREQGKGLVTVKDQVIFERDEVLTQDGRPFSVFTPYKRAWLRKLDLQSLAPLESTLTGRLAPVGTRRLEVGDNSAWTCGDVPSLDALGFESTGLRELGITPGASGAETLFANFSPRIGRYAALRDQPALRGPSYLSVHLRFGTISIRRLARLAWETQHADPQAADGAQTWLSELIWREFYFQILWHHPRVVERAFKPEYDAIVWDNDPQRFRAWCEGRTGYPLVDAAMTQMNRTGYMHNRLRMVSASFLTKDLGIDWRWGERYFAEQLIDHDLSANNGGWQWAASSGCDAQPWFRIFNPVTQSKRFDPQGAFIRRYLPELSGLSEHAIHEPWRASSADLARAGLRLGEHYPMPVVDHDSARKTTLERYSVVRRGASEGGGAT